MIHFFIFLLIALSSSRLTTCQPSHIQRGDTLVPCVSLSEALTQVQDGETIVVDPTTSPPPSIPPLVITKENITIKGRGEPSTTSISLSSSSSPSPWITFSSHVTRFTLHNISISNIRKAANASRVSLNIDNCVLTSYGSSIISKYDAYKAPRTSLTIKNSNLSDDSSTLRTSSSDDDNKGGLLLLSLSSSNIIIEGVNFTGGRTSSTKEGKGGCIYLATFSRDATHVTMKDVTLQDCISHDGGGMYVEAQSLTSASTITFTNIQAISNKAFGRGGGICLNALSSRTTTTTWNGVMLRQNIANKGGGIYLSSDVINALGASRYFSGDTAFIIRDNESVQQGGGMYIEQGDTDQTIESDIRIVNCKAGSADAANALNSIGGGGGLRYTPTHGFGGGIAIEKKRDASSGAITLAFKRHSFPPDFSLRQTRNIAKYGGFLYTNCAIVIKNLYTYKNISRSSGGGLYLEGVSSRLKNADMEGDRSLAGQGGGIYGADATMDATGITLARSEARQEGGCVFLTGKLSSVIFRELMAEGCSSDSDGPALYISPSSSTSSIYIKEGSVISNSKSPSSPSPAIVVTASSGSTVTYTSSGTEYLYNANGHLLMKAFTSFTSPSPPTLHFSSSSDYFDATSISTTPSIQFTSPTTTKTLTDTFFDGSCGTSQHNNAVAMKEHRTSTSTVNYKAGWYGARAFKSHASWTCATYTDTPPSSTSATTVAPQYTCASHNMCDDGTKANPKVPRSYGDKIQTTSTSSTSSTSTTTTTTTTTTTKAPKKTCFYGFKSCGWWSEWSHSPWYFDWWQ